MLFIPDGNEPFRIFSIDPGTNTLGTVVIDIDLTTLGVSLQHAMTFKGNSMMRHMGGDIADIHGDREAKLRAHHDNLLKLLSSYQPNVVICEAPFIGRFAASGLALNECLCALRRAVAIYDPSLPLETVEPQAAKAAVGAAFKGSQKEDVRKGVLQQNFLQNPYGIDIRSLDEHTIDAIAIGIYKAKLVCGSLGSPYI